MKHGLLGLLIGASLNLAFRSPSYQILKGQTIGTAGSHSLLVNTDLKLTVIDRQTSDEQKLNNRGLHAEINKLDIGYHVKKKTATLGHYSV